MFLHRMEETAHFFWRKIREPFKIERRELINTLPCLPFHVPQSCSDVRNSKWGERIIISSGSDRGSLRSATAASAQLCDL
eukprot:4186246-Pyramimonas_sp.AAC.1